MELNERVRIAQVLVCDPDDAVTVGLLRLLNHSAGTLPQSAPQADAMVIPGGMELRWRFQSGETVIEQYTDVLLQHIADTDRRIRARETQP